jgi:hypothetical protein
VADETSRETRRCLTQQELLLYNVINEPTADTGADVQQPARDSK